MTDVQQNGYELLKDGVAPDEPPNTYIALLNDPGEPLTTWIVFPNAGTAWIAYEFMGEPAKELYIWHQGGAKTPIKEGFGTYTIGARDALVCVAQSPESPIKLGWAYV